jgi:hypothetical protein
VRCHCVITALKAKLVIISSTSGPADTSIEL